MRWCWTAGYWRSRRLQRRAYDVIIAVDGQEGVDKARSDAPDVILMDMSLTVLDGWQATKLLKAAPETRSIPIIALIAHAMIADRQAAQRLARRCEAPVRRAFPTGYAITSAKISFA